MKKTFQFSVITIALMASNAFAAQVNEGTANTIAGDDSIAVGTLNNVDNSATVIGYRNTAQEQNAFAAGSYNNVTGSNSTAVGYDARILNSSNNSTAIGINIDVHDSNSVLVGHDVSMTGKNATGIGTNNNVRGDNAVSLGQLSWADGENSTSIGTESWARGENTTSLGYNVELGSENATGIGWNANAAKNATSVGYHAQALLEDTAALGANTVANDKNSVALGYNSDTYDLIGDSNGVVTVGSVEGTNFTRQITQVNAGVNDTDAINVSQLNEAIAGLNPFNDEYLASIDTRLQAVADERDAAISEEARIRAAADAALDADLNTEAQARLAGDTAQTNLRTQAIAETRIERLKADAALRVERITAIANEKAERIAADQQQVQDRIAAINTESASRIAGDAYQRAQLNTAVSYLDNRINTEATARSLDIERLDGRINQTNKRLDELEKSAYRGVAIALAAQQAVPNIHSGQIAVFAGIGHYEGESAGSIGLVTSLLSNRISLTGSVGFASGDEVGSRVGLTYAF